MPTLRETIQADIAAIETDLAAKKAKLAEIETGFVGVLDRDVEDVKSFFRAVAAHIFPHAAALQTTASTGNLLAAQQASQQPAAALAQA